MRGLTCARGAPPCAAGAGGVLLVGQEAVARAPHRLDPVGSELVAQVAHIHVDDVGAWIEVEAPDPGEELLAAEDLVGVAHELLQQRVFAGGELDRLLPHERPARTHVEGEVSHPQYGRLPRVRGTKPQAHASEQLIEGERFAHVVIRPAGEPGDGVFNGVARREDDDGNVDALRPDPTQHAEPIQPRQPEIQDEEIEIPREFHGRVSVGHRVGLEPFRPEPFLNKIRDALLVLGDEYPVHSSSLTGNTSVNVAPRPGLESTVTSPPCAWAIRRTIARPSPLLRSRLFSGPERTNRSKMRCWSSRAIPLPSSRTHK